MVYFLFSSLNFGTLGFSRTKCLRSQEMRKGLEWTNTSGTVISFFIFEFRSAWFSHNMLALSNDGISLHEVKGRYCTRKTLSI